MNESNAAPLSESGKGITAESEMMTIRVRRKMILGIALSAIAGILGSLMVAKATSRGIGVTSDSAAYLSMANSLRESGLYNATGDDGLAEPIIHKPPGYPASLALISSVFRTTLLQAARWESVACFGAAASLLGYWVATAIGGPVWLSAFAVSMFVLTPGAAQVYSMALSEPGFLFLGFLGLFLIVRDFSLPQRWRTIGAGLALSAAWMFRHAGVTLVVTGVAGILDMSNLHRRPLLKRASLVAGLAAVPTAIFYGRNQLIAGRTTTATLHVVMISVKQLKDLCWQLSTWLVPAFEPRWLWKMSFIGVATAGTVVFIRDHRGTTRNSTTESRHRTLRILFILCVVYVGFIVLCKLLLFVAIPFDYRLLIPLLPALVLLFCCGIAAADAIPQESKLLDGGVAAAAVLLLVIRVGPAREWLRQRQSGRWRYVEESFAEPSWKASPLVAVAGELSKRAPAGTIVSNAPDLLEFETGGRFAALPVRQDYYSGALNPRYRDELRSLVSSVRKGQKTVVGLKALESRVGDPSIRDLRLEIGDRYCRDFRDGIVCGLLPEEKP